MQVIILNWKGVRDMKHWGANIYMLILFGMAILLILLGLFRVWLH